MYVCQLDKSCHVCVYIHRAVEDLSRLGVLQVACGGHHNLALVNSESIIHACLYYSRHVKVTACISDWSWVPSYMYMYMYIHTCMHVSGPNAHR